MSEWIRKLIRPTGASEQWHIARDKGLNTWTLCGERFEGAIEVASSEDRTSRGGRCATCEKTLAEKRAPAASGVRMS